MQSSKSFILSFIILVTSIAASAQPDEVLMRPERSKKYALILYLSGGFGYFPSNDGAPAYLQPKRGRINPVTTARIMWKPDHRLKAGFESGYMTFYSYSLTTSDGQPGKVALDAIPLLLEFSVSIKKHLNLFAGPGFYILNTRLNYQGKTESKKVNPGWMAAAAYTVPFTKAFSLGAEAKWLYASETIRGSFGVQLQVTWRFLRW